MSRDDPSELTQHYGGRTSSGEMARRLDSPIYGTPVRRSDYSPERTVTSPAHIADQFTFFEHDDHQSNPRGVLRRRPTDDNDTTRKYSIQGHGRTISAGSGPVISTDSSRKPLRTSKESFRQESPTDRHQRRDDFHPDFYERSRPPRTHRNTDWNRQPGSASKSTFEETRGGYDLEKGVPERAPLKNSKKMRASEDDDVDGYNYEQQKRHYNKNKPGYNDFQKEQEQKEKELVLRLPWTQWMNSNFKNHFVATMGEFMGTMMFLFFAFAGTQVANIGSSDSGTNTTSGKNTGFNVSVYLYISIAFGFSLMVNVWVFFRISGGLFNPAVTLGMVLVGALPVVRAIFLFMAQIAGGIAASAMVLGLYPTTLNVGTKLSGGASRVQGVFIEAILTAELVFTIFMLAKEKHKATFIAPVGIGLALFIAEMVSVYYTGGSLNPARSFGPAVVTGVFDENHWIYWVGPFAGTFIAVFFYKFIKMLEYEMANPGQDGDDQNDPTKNEAKRLELMEQRAHRMGRLDSTEGERSD